MPGSSRVVRAWSLTMLLALLLYGLSAYVTESGTAYATRQQQRQQRQQPDVNQALRAACRVAGSASPASPMNHTPRDFLVDQPHVCSGDVFLLLAVHSAVGHFARRRLIRTTWGSVRNVRGDRLVTVFFVGTSQNRSDEESLRREAAAQADIVQADFVDSYRNLTYKHLYWMKWVTQRCRSLRFVMKVDDDVMVNVFHLHQALSEPMADWKNFMRCWINRNSPVRSGESKWRVTWQEWPHATYPPYCNGLGILYSADTLQRLRACATWRQLFWIDDVFVTGSLAEALDIPRLPWSPGWEVAEVTPDMAGPKVDSVVLMVQFGANVMPRLCTKVWNAVLRYSVY